MKRFIYLAAGLVAVAATVTVLSTSPVIAQNSGGDYQKIMDDQAARSKRYNELLHEQEDMHKRAENLEQLEEQVVHRQAAQADRFDKLLDTWERQQKQYQKYLDSLRTH